MKQLWICTALLAVLVAGGLVNARYALALSDRLTLPLIQAQELAREERWEEAQVITHQVYDDWQDSHFYLHTAMKHADTDDILRGFRGVLRYLELREMDQYAAANTDLIARIELLAEMEQATLVNVL